ncbi:MAG: hypothetical protein LBR85_02125 [Oscillospiraceae bacterium]|jgi:tRNA nucleotidyltransferase (CCA-adding enzyme)|nr:hypothetical protein [Oscillospiraceae bacterium]
MSMFPVTVGLPASAALILSRLNARGFKAYAVGGCVRDSLLGLAPKDWDVCSSAVPEQVHEVFEDFRVLDTGREYGTVTLVMPDGPVEVTTLRADGLYGDARRPDSVSFGGSLTDDLARRDFTVNAMAWHPETGLCDPFGGQKDLAAGILRCVGDARARFGEDALRVLRCLRFASVLGFAIQPDTDRALRESKALLARVAAERISNEFAGLLTGKDAAKILCEYAEVFAVFLTEYKNVRDWEFGVRVLRRTPPELDTRLAALTLPLGADAAAEALVRLRFSRQTVRAVKEFISCAFQEKTPESAAARIARARTLKEAGLALGGADLLACGLSPGPRIGEILAAVREEVLCGTLENEHAALLRRAVDIIAKKEYTPA